MKRVPLIVRLVFGLLLFSQSVFSWGQDDWQEALNGSFFHNNQQPEGHWPEWSVAGEAIQLGSTTHLIEGHRFSDLWDMGAAAMEKYCHCPVIASLRTTS